MNTEQELADFIKRFIQHSPICISLADCEIRAFCPDLAKNLLSSGLVIPVSALDGMADKIVNEYKDIQYHGMISPMDNADYAQAALNADGIGKE